MEDTPISAAPQEVDEDEQNVSELSYVI